MTPSVRQAHPQPWRQAHEEVEVYGSRWDLLLFVAGIFAVLLVLSLAGSPA